MRSRVRVSRRLIVLQVICKHYKVMSLNILNILIWLQIVSQNRPHIVGPELFQEAEKNRSTVFKTWLAISNYLR